MDDKSKELLQDCFLRPVADPRSTNSHNELSTKKPTLKAELQLLTLSNEAQELVMNTLTSIHGPDFKFPDTSTIKDNRNCLKKFYWEDRGRLVVQGITNFSNMTSQKTEVNTDDRIRKYALMKLESYGFASNHCVEALDHCSNDIDQALELLFSKYMKCDIGNNNSIQTNEYTEAELLEMRNDEKQALESIYDKTFEEKEKDHVWSLKLDVSYLLEYSPSEARKFREEEQNKREKLENQKKVKEKCRNFAKGFCKFGDKCRFSHEVPQDANNSKKTDEVKEFFLEIRFPQNSRYPYEPPLIFLKTTCYDLPSEIILKICRKLFKEAQQLANDGMPSIYTICELIQTRDDIKKFLSEDFDDFLDPDKSLFEIENEKTNKTNEIDKELPSHHKKGTTSLSDRLNLTKEQILLEDQNLARKFILKCDNRNYQNMLKIRNNLPVWKQMPEILSTIESNQVIVISGETGCGKSTQVPQFILDDWLLNTAKQFSNNTKDCHQHKQRHIEIICTQPRRLSAIGVAERVAQERNEQIGHTIGYQIRLENKISHSTRLTFCTTGILLQRLHSEPYLESITHIIVDEVHERSQESDFLLMILKKILSKRKDLKIILMSATLNAELFSKYFSSVPVLEIPGRTFPVEQIFLEDILDRISFVLDPDTQYCRKLTKKESEQLEGELGNDEIRAALQLPSNKAKDEKLSLAEIKARYSDSTSTTCRNLFLMNPMKINPELVESILEYIVDGDHDWPKEGSILIFLPGFAEIKTMYETLCDSSTFNPRYGKYIILPLHSSLSNDEQSRIFEKVPQGKRRIILSTNVAETSITIDDCVFVIDSGLMKETCFDTNKNMQSLELVWVSKANAKQRKGRAGRVMPGICIHLFTSYRYKYQFLNQPVPEILRVPLEQLILRIKTLPNFNGCDIITVTNQIIEPPKPENISSALLRLQCVGATDKKNELTPLGHHLSVLPVDVRIGKLILLGAIFQCLDSILTIAACLSHKSLFLTPFNKKLLATQKKRIFAVANSDHLTFLNAYKKWNEVRKKSKYSGRCFAQENLLSCETLESISDVKYQFLELLVLIGFVPIDLPRKDKNINDRILEITGHELNCNGDNSRLLIALLCAALYPNVVKILTPEKNYIKTAGGAVPQEPQAHDLRFTTHQDGFVSIHPSSINYNSGNFISPFLIYQEKIKTTKIFIRECSMVPLISLVLFSGSDLQIEFSSNSFILLLDNGWIMIKSQNQQIAQMIQCLRNELSKLLEEKLKDPCLNLLNHKNGKKIITAIQYLVSKA